MKKLIALKKIIAVISFVAVVLIAIPMIFKTLGHMDSVKWYDSYPVVAHALGTSGAEPYNSLEGFNWSYEHGQRVFECDFARTSDGKMVLAHSFEETGQQGIDEEHIPTLEQFLNSPLEGQFTPLSYGDMIELMGEHKDMYLVTDFKCDDSGMSLDQMDAMVAETRAAGAEDIFERIIVQFYDESELAQIQKKAKFGGYIFTLYKKDFDGSCEEFETIAKFCHRNKVDVVVMKKGLWTQKLQPVADKYKIKVFPHTIYTAWQARFNIEAGAAGAYCDGVTLEDYKQLKGLPEHWYSVDESVCIVETGTELADYYAGGERSFYLTNAKAAEIKELLEKYKDIYVIIGYDEALVGELSSLTSGRAENDLINRLVVCTDSLYIGKTLKPYFFWCDVIYDSREEMQEIASLGGEESRGDMFGLVDDVKEKGISCMLVSEELWGNAFNNYAEEAGIYIIKEIGGLK